MLFGFEIDFIVVFFSLFFCCAVFSELCELSQYLYTFANPDVHRDAGRGTNVVANGQIVLWISSALIN